MKLKVFSVLDTKAGVFEAPFFGQSEGVVVRSWADEINNPRDPRSPWTNHPGDFTLYLLGEFDNVTGSFDLVKPRAVITASALSTKLAVPSVNGVEVVN